MVSTPLFVTVSSPINSSSDVPVTVIGPWILNVKDCPIRLICIAKLNRKKLNRDNFITSCICFSPTKMQKLNENKATSAIELSQNNLKII
jgi:hypothetical protein